MQPKQPTQPTQFQPQSNFGTANNTDSHESGADTADTERAHARQSVAAAEAAAQRARDRFKYHAISLLMLERTILEDEQRGNVEHAAALRGLIERYNANVEAATDAAISAAAALQQAQATLSRIEQAQGQQGTSA